MLGRHRILTIALGSLLLGSALAIDESGRHQVADAAVVRAVFGAISSPGDMFAARSPGARRSGELLSTKGVRVKIAQAPVLGAPGAPEERVLAQVREHPAEPLAAVDALPPAPVGPLTGFNAPTGLPPFAYAEPGYPDDAFAPGPLGGVGGPAFLGEPGFLGGPGRLVGPGGPSGPDGVGAPGGPGSGGASPPLGVDGGGGGGAVPEPSTWALMILASFVIGSRLRRMRPRRATPLTQNPLA
jgi:hypothetical protein